jgi:hypothetical protein
MQAALHILFWLCCGVAALRPFELSLTAVYKANVVIGAAYEVLAQSEHRWTKELTVCAWLDLTNSELDADAPSPRSSATCLPGTLGMIPLDIKSSGSYKLSAVVVPKGLASLNDRALQSDVATLSFEASLDATIPHDERGQMIRSMRTALAQQQPSEQRESLWEMFHEQVRQLLLDPDTDPFMIRTKPELRAFMEPCVPIACVQQLQLLQAHPRWSQVCYCPYDLVLLNEVLSMCMYHIWLMSDRVLCCSTEI